MNLQLAADRNASVTDEQPAKKRRRNTPRACDYCKAKKSKCNGTFPCSRCDAHSLQCSYATPYSRGLAPPAIPTRSASSHSPLVATGSVDGESQQSLAESLATPTRSKKERQRSEITTITMPDYGGNDVEGVLGQSSNLAFSHAAGLELSSRPPSPPRSVSHRTGFLGLSAESTYASKTEGESYERLTGHAAQAKAEEKSWLYFAEPPFPELNLARYTLPNVERGLEMCTWYFENASPTYRFLHRPSVEKLVRPFCGAGEWLGGGKESDENSRISRNEECIVLMVWALACQYPMSRIDQPYSDRERAWLRQKGMDYYQVCQLLLEKDKALVDRLSTIQVRLMMCLYLLTTSRLKAAWDLFAVVKNMANNLDLNRTDHVIIRSSSSSRETGQVMTQDILQAEQRKRTFWSIYTLDTYLCAMLGKCLMFDENDVKIDHATVDDDLHGAEHHDGRSSSYLPFSHSSLLEKKPSLMWAPTAHAKLARIVRASLKGLYLDQVPGDKTVMMDGLIAQMQIWESELPAIFHANTSGLLPVYGRQSTVLKLAQQHALIMIYRPSLPLSRFADASESDGAISAPGTRQHRDRCLDAAFTICDIITSLFNQKGISEQFWFSAYITFCAATVMLVYMAHNLSMSDEQIQQIWDGSQRCTDILRKISSNNKLAGRYVAALVNLAQRVSKRMAAIPARTRLPSRAMNTEDYLPHEQLTSLASEQLSMQAPVFGPNEYPEALFSPYGGPMTTGVDWNQQPWDQLMTEFPENASFFDLDSLVSGGKYWYGLG